MTRRGSGVRIPQRPHFEVIEGAVWHSILPSILVSNQFSFNMCSAPLPDGFGAFFVSFRCAGVRPRLFLLRFLLLIHLQSVNRSLLARFASDP